MRFSGWSASLLLLSLLQLGASWNGGPGGNYNFGFGYGYDNGYNVGAAYDFSGWDDVIGGGEESTANSACLEAPVSPYGSIYNGCAGVKDDWNVWDEDMCKTSEWYTDCCIYDEGGDENGNKCMQNKAAYDCDSEPEKDGEKDGCSKANNDEDKCMNLYGEYPWHGVCCEWKGMKCKHIPTSFDCADADDKCFTEDKDQCTNKYGNNRWHAACCKWRRSRCTSKDEPDFAEAPQQIEYRCRENNEVGIAWSRLNTYIGDYFHNLWDCATYCVSKREADPMFWFIDGATWDSKYKRCWCEFAMYGFDQGGRHGCFYLLHKTCFAPKSVDIRELTSCEKREGSYAGTVVRELKAWEAQQSGWWSWMFCAAECADNDDCEFWTLELGKGKSCFLMKDRGYHYIADENQMWNVKQDWCLTRLFEPDHFVHGRGCGCQTLDTGGARPHPPFCYAEGGDRKRCYVNLEWCEKWEDDPDLVEHNEVVQGYATAYCHRRGAYAKEAPEGYEWAGGGSRDVKPYDCTY